MSDWFRRVAEQLADNPVLQGIAAAIGTFILEDPTTVTSGLLVADGRMAFSTAMIGLSSGIVLGDFCLYLAGRWIAPSLVSWGLISRDRLARGEKWFARNLITAVLVSRFVPGMRVPAYISAGILRAHPIYFLGLVIVASLAWTFLLLKVTVTVGTAALPALGPFKWPIVAVIILLWILLQKNSARWLSRESPDARPQSPPTTSVFEFWPPVIFYAPVAVYYAWLALRYRSFTLPTAANPRIYSGGMVKESKSVILDLVSESQRHWIAPYTAFDRTDEPLDLLVSRAESAMHGAGLTYPVVAKPDEGQRGAGVQVVENEAALRAYCAAFPVGVRIILQALIDEPEEAGVLYYRLPHRAMGEIFSVTLKRFPTLVGDGKRTLRELILQDDRAYAMQHVYCARHEQHLDRVLADGESFTLVFSGNHAQGAIFLDGCNQTTPELARRFHEIASSIPEFYFGRFDVRFRDLDSFRFGEGFRIVEINGAGAEATHIWDANMKLGEAYRTLFAQFRILFEIGAANRVKGVRPLGPIRLLRDFRQYLHQAKGYPGSH